MLRHDHNLRRDRKQYFAEIPPTGDLFLDPDTGIKTGGRDQIEKYLQATELFELMEGDEGQLVVVYQHVRAGTVRQRVRNVWDFLDQQKRPFSCTSYESGTVALLFFSQNCDRAKAVRECFGQLLGTHSHGRIWYQRLPGG